jgi:hypothetical protein
MKLVLFAREFSSFVYWSFDDTNDSENDCRWKGQVAGAVFIYILYIAVSNHILPFVNWNVTHHQSLLKLESHRCDVTSLAMCQGQTSDGLLERKKRDILLFAAMSAKRACISWTCLILPADGNNSNEDVMGAQLAEKKRTRSFVMAAFIPARGSHFF